MRLSEISSCCSDGDVKEMEKAIANLVKAENTDIKQKQDMARLHINQCQLVLVNTYPLSNQNTSVKDSPLTQVHICLSISPSVYVCLSVCQSVCLLSVCCLLCQSVCCLLCQSVCLLCVHQSVCCLSVCQSVSICLSVCQFFSFWSSLAYLSVCLFHVAVVHSLFGGVLLSCHSTAGESPPLSKDAL